MDTVKIMHCADLHFDTPFADIGDVDKVEQRKEDLRETFGQIIDMAKDEGVQILLIGGDLFDGKSVMRMTLEYILKKINEIPDIKVFIAPGNHDPYTEKSYYKIMDWPPNVHIFDNTFGCIKLPELNTKIYGIGFSQAYEKECLIKGFTSDDDNNIINIMVIHGEIVEGKRECNYNPLTYQDIERTNVDYIALGHKHSYSGINRIGRTYWAYCGTPEGRGFDELGDKGVIIGDIGKGYVDLEFRKICKREYIQKEIDITGVSTYEDIEELIMSKIADKNSKNDLYKIILAGEVPEGNIFNISVIKQKLEDKFYYLKVVDDTKLKIDYNALKNEFSLKGLFVRKMLDRIENTNDEEQIEQYLLAMKIGLKSLENESGDLY